MNSCIELMQVGGGSQYAQTWFRGGQGRHTLGNLGDATNAAGGVDVGEHAGSPPVI